MKKYMGLLIAVFCVLLAPLRPGGGNFGLHAGIWQGNRGMADADRRRPFHGVDGQKGQVSPTDPWKFPQGTQVAAFYLEADPQPASLTIKTKNDRGKWEETFTGELSCAQALVTLDQPLSGQAQLVLRYNTTVIPAWRNCGCMPPESHGRMRANGSTPTAWTCSTSRPARSCRWTACVPGRRKESRWRWPPCKLRKAVRYCPWLDALWDAGVHTEPFFGDFRALKESEAADPEKVKKAWSEKKLTAWAVSRLRETKPLCLALDASDIPAAQVAREIWSAAVPLAAQSDYELEDAGIHGLWLTPSQTQGDTLPTLITRAQAEEHPPGLPLRRSSTGLRTAIPRRFPTRRGATAKGICPATNSFMRTRSAACGHIFSETLQVQIVRYEDTDPVRVWFEAEGTLQAGA